MIFKKFLKHLFLFCNSIFLDKYEKEFINVNKKKTIKKLKKKNILVQIVTDYYYLAYYKTLINDPKYSNYNFIGLWPYFQQTVRKRYLILEIFNEFYNKFIFLFIYIKWCKLYKSIGIRDIETIDSFSFLTKKNNKKKIFFKSRDDLLNFKINTINVGDIIYDTYLRFRASPTLFLKDHFLKKLIHKCYEIIFNLEKIFKKYNFVFFFTSYSSYIHHGLPVRFFLKKKVVVYSGKNNSQYNKHLTNNDLSHVEDFRKYKLYFNEIKKNKKLLEFSKHDLLKRFSKKKKLNSNLSYLLTDTYNVKKNSNQEKNKLKNIDGVLFLQDFYDSPHDWGDLAFSDFYIWTIFTLNIIRKYKLKIAIKPHPNSWHNSADSVVLYERLKKRYRNITWLNKDFPNKLIFKNIKFGISCTGTVLFELAYHGIKAISCGTHPGIHFKFTIHAKNKFEYKYNLLNISKIKIPNFSKIDLLVYNYLYYYYNMDAFNNVARLINLKQTDLTTSKGLDEFNRKYENYVIHYK
jgi:hypothetical protein